MCTCATFFDDVEKLTRMFEHQLLLQLEFQRQEDRSVFHPQLLVKSHSVHLGIDMLELEESRFQVGHTSRKKEGNSNLSTAPSIWRFQS